MQIVLLFTNSLSPISTPLSLSLSRSTSVQLFDMKKFQSNVNRELRRAYPDRRRLETQCLSAVAFVKSENDILECPIWVLIVNVVAMDMLKSKMPPGELQVCRCILASVCLCVFILEMGALWGCHGYQENERTINTDVLHEFCSEFQF